MRQAQKKKEKDKVAIVILLTFCVIALTSIFAVKANIDKINQNVPDMPVLEETKSDDSKKENKGLNSKVQNQESNELGVQISKDIPTIDSADNTASSHYISPINHSDSYVTNPYSMDKLIYSVTLDQYMTHNGLDIQAPEDSQVLAVAEGTVTAVYNDDRYGTSIEITHPGNIISIYSNLSTAEMVEIGDVVTQGQIIAGVGSTGLFESLEPAHLHFEMIKDGSYVNPQEYISF